MKGRDRHSLEHGLEQIISLRNKLKSEFSEHFPFGAKAIVQGILLCPFEAQIPQNKINALAEDRRNGIVVLALRYRYKAELFPYISKINKLTEKYLHENLPHDDALNFVEHLLINRAMPHREQDEQSLLHRSSGIYINYALSDNREYATLIANDAQTAIFVKAETDEYIDQIKAVLTAVSWQTKFSCRKLE